MRRRRSTAELVPEDVIGTREPLHLSAWNERKTL